jgi:hypothetical protein
MGARQRVGVFRPVGREPSPQRERARGLDRPRRNRREISTMSPHLGTSRASVSRGGVDTERVGGVDTL